MLSRANFATLGNQSLGNVDHIPGGSLSARPAVLLPATHVVQPSVTAPSLSQVLEPRTVYLQICDSPGPFILTSFKAVTFLVVLMNSLRHCFLTFVSHTAHVIANIILSSSSSSSSSSSVVSTHADSSRVGIALITSVIPSVRMLKPKRLKLKSPNLARG